MAATKTHKTVRQSPPLDLLHHGLVAALLGMPLAIWLSGALVYHAPWAADSLNDISTYQVTMWVVPPLWATVVSLAFLAPSKRILWAALLTGNALAWGLLRAVQA
ncbi:MAG: hypothetical protein LWW82_07880 [Comamonadaceae bacterium]|nr:hypothetical protein [Comamonadaceae bacterium]